MTPLPAEFYARPFAHRALHDVAKGRPENSREAVAAAIERGYGIEIDIQMSADHAAMVFHDYDMARLAGTSGAIQTRTASELAAIPLTGGNSPMPTLAETLAQVAGRVPLLVEIKDQDGKMGPNIGPLEAAVARAVNAYDGPLALMSFNPHSAAELARLCPARPCGLTTCDYNPKDWTLYAEEERSALRAMPGVDKLAFISHDRNSLDMPEVAAFKATGRPVLTWTIRSEAQAKEALTIADAITFEGYLPD
ncbi:phosphodiesterase [Alphaproteobacteria bacterium KMM 3653]|uniref:Phosphodiesterase n=1 Tax=Harenicola maris TaxID=2841044 RepID=A0AAP2CMW0_9RHOB|nr:phosphodiesterase [Harenicola maris]